MPAMVAPGTVRVGARTTTVAVSTKPSEMSPRAQVTAPPVAYVAGVAGTVSTGPVAYALRNCTGRICRTVPP